VQQAVTEPEKSAMPPQEKKNDPIAFGRSPDRTKTILTVRVESRKRHADLVEKTTLSHRLLQASLSASFIV